MTRKNSLILSFFLVLSLLLGGCTCSNYKTYVGSMDADLQELTPMVESYVNSDERLSDADRRARLAVLEQMKAKTELAKKDIE